MAGLLFRLKLAAVAHAPGFVVRRIMLPRLDAEVDETGEPELLEFGKLLTRGDLALDVGSNVGAYAYALSRVTGRVLALEPNPGLARMLTRMGLDGVEVRQIAASDRDGTAELHVPAGGQAHMVASLRHDDEDDDAELLRITVPTRRLDGLDLADVRFIKIDVEGFEEQVLFGAEALLARDRPLLLIEIEERRNPGGLARICLYLRERGYAAAFLRDGRWTSISEFDADRDQDVAVLRQADYSPRSGARRYVHNFLFTPDNAVLH